jgi:hypothetical protein
MKSFGKFDFFGKNDSHSEMEILRCDVMWWHCPRMADEVTVEFDEKRRPSIQSSSLFIGIRVCWVVLAQEETLARNVKPSTHIYMVLLGSGAATIKSVALAIMARR